MIPTLLWILLSLQILMGAFDTLFHHELTERLAWRQSQKLELRLHGVRNLLYGALFAGLGCLMVTGALAWIVLGVLLIELCITLKDFVEEDQTRKLPASERVTHTLLALNYGAILVLLVPILLQWTAEPTGVAQQTYGLWTAFMLLSALGVSMFGFRDLFAARRLHRMVYADAACRAPSSRCRAKVVSHHWRYRVYRRAPCGSVGQQQSHCHRSDPPNENSGSSGDPRSDHNQPRSN